MFILLVHHIPGVRPQFRNPQRGLNDTHNRSIRSKVAQASHGKGQNFTWQKKIKESNKDFSFYRSKTKISKTLNMRNYIETQSFQKNTRLRHRRGCTCPRGNVCVEHRSLIKHTVILVTFFATFEFHSEFLRYFGFV